MNINKIIFLDIDGVLNRQDASGIYDPKSTLPECLNLINQAISETNCSIVIISNWAQTLGLQRLQSFFTERGLLPNAIMAAIEPVPLDDTGMIMGIEKDRYIKEYISKNNIESYVIVDDNLNSDILDLNKMIKPNTFTGITEKEKNKIIEILSL